MLSEKQIVELQKPFEFKEHGFYERHPYILKSAIRARLNRVTPGWILLPPEVVTHDENVVVMRGGIQIGDVKRYAIGTGIVLRGTSEGEVFSGAKLAGMISKAYKQATSDILPRAAVEFGIGEYLKNKPKDIKEANFAPWLAKLTADPNAWTVENILTWGDKWHALGLTDVQLMNALNITERWTEFKGTVAEADKAVEASRTLQASFSHPVDLAKTYGSRVVLECDTNLLEPGDIVMQPGTPTAYLEVVTAPVRTGGTFPYQLTVKNLATGETETVQWGGIAYQQLVAGPKVKAYLENPRLGYEPAHGSTPKWTPKPADAEVPPVVGKLPSVICKTSQLEPGDVFQQTPRSAGSRQYVLFKVLTTPTKRNTSYWFSSKNYSTGHTGDNGWGEGDHTLVAGPKCEAYAKDPSVCVEEKGQYPRWRGEAVKA